MIEWRGPAPFVFAPVPDDPWGEVRFAASEASYGWGVVPVTARITPRGGSGFAFSTSLFPPGETNLLPVKKAVQIACDIVPGDAVDVTMQVVRR